MCQRIAQAFDDARIHFDVLALDLEPHGLVVRPRHVAYRAPVLPEERPDGHHAGLGHLLLEIELETVGLEMRLENVPAELVWEPREHLRDAAAGDRDFTGEVEHAIELGDVHAQRPGFRLGSAVAVQRRFGRRRRSVDRPSPGGGDGGECGLQAGRDHVLSGRGACEELAQHVHRAQQHADQLTMHLDFAQAHAVEQIFDVVREVGDRGKADHPRVALEAVNGAEDLLERRRVLGARFQRDQRLLDAAEMLRRFGQEGLEHQRAIFIGERHQM